MKTKLKICVLALAVAFVASFAIRSVVVSAQTQTPPATQTVTAGQKFKNIKVLNDMPADQLGKVMNLFSASLGVNCTFCHVAGDKDFDKDDKKEKTAARNMIKMTLEINKGHFDGKTEVSCNTCHGGREHPVGVPNLNPVTPVERPKQPETKPTVDQILDKYVAAIGGKDNLAKVTSRYIKLNRVERNGKMTVSQEAWQKAGRFRLDTQYPNFLINEVYDGTTVWKLGNNAPIELKADEMEQVKREAQLFGNGDIKTIYPKMEFRFVDRINDREAYLVTATTADNQRERLYFDVATGFLVRRTASAPTMFGPFVYQIDYSDYKDYGGVKLPSSARFAVPGLSWSRNLLEVKNNAAVDDSKFAAPKN